MKSTFRQKTREYAYIAEEEYYCGGMTGLRVEVDDLGGDLISDDIVATCDSITNVFKVGERCLLHTTGEYVTIKSAVRCTDGSMVYYINDKFVETENSEKQRLILEKEVDEYNYEWCHGGRKIARSDIMEEYTGYRIWDKPSWWKGEYEL